MEPKLSFDLTIETDVVLQYIDRQLGFSETASRYYYVLKTLGISDADIFTLGDNQGCGIAEAELRLNDNANDPFEFPRIHYIEDLII